MCRRPFRKALGDSGVAAIEFAFVLPVLLLMAFGLIDFGRAVWTQTSLDYAVQYAARWAALQCANAVSGCPADSDIQTYAANSAFAISVSSSNFTALNPTDDNATCATGQNGVRVSLNNTFTFTYIFPAFTAYSGPMTATACFPT